MLGSCPASTHGAISGIRGHGAAAGSPSPHGLRGAQGAGRTTLLVVASPTLGQTAGSDSSATGEDEPAAWSRSGDVMSRPHRRTLPRGPAK